ncbi:MAG: superinfection immunity protein [Betaproteobacteria bacterium]|nr:superinfection immunity protein [Betaproteobacteria bacterium]
MTAIIVVIAAYFFPTIVAALRGHLNGGAIFMLNLLTGWTLLGWMLALVWAMTNNTRRTNDNLAMNARLDAVEQATRTRPTR